MHAEWCSLAGADALAPAPGRRFAVGTTSVRTLEAFAQRHADHPGEPAPEWLETRLLIAPGHEFAAVDGVLTNFHLPRSTLLALIAAMFEGGMGRVREIYAEAIRELGMSHYRTTGTSRTPEDRREALRYFRRYLKVAPTAGDAEYVKGYLRELEAQGG